MNKRSKRRSGYSKEPYFQVSPGIASRPQELSLALPDATVPLQTDRGVFSYTHIDAGTKVLLRVAPPPPTAGDLLDLGCGYGPIAITLARRYPERTVWAVDVNERALGLVRENAARLNLANVRPATPDAVVVPELAAIYSNPPVRVGKGVMRELLLEWLARLSPEGRAYWVVKQNLGADSLAQYLSEQGYLTIRFRAKQGYRVLESCRAASR